MTDVEIRAAAREYTRQSRVEQGLPEHVSDPSVVAQLAALLGGGVDDR